MTRLSRGFWLAAGLIVLAVAAPCFAWYLAGSHAVDQQSAQLRTLVRDRGEQIALGLAERLRGRLEAMADAESLRPFYYFQSSFHDPTSSCECSSRSPSPLADGPQDPFIATYFQIDSRRGLSLLAGDARPTSMAQADLRQDLSSAVSQCLLAVGAPEDPEMPSWRAVPLDDGPSTVELLAQDPNLHVDPFQWHGVDLDSGPSLVALRRVEGSNALLVQGFVLSREAVQGWLDAAEWPAQLRPSPEIHQDRLEVYASVPLECTQWEVAVRVDAGINDARLQTRQLRRGFHRNFAAGSTAAGVGALALLFVLGWRERSERQRAHFAAAAAHELRTPLTGLRLYSEMLVDPKLGPDKREDYARRIAGEAHRLGRVVTNVLAFTGLESGGGQVDLRSIDLARELSQLVLPLREITTLAGAELVVEESSIPAPVRADPEAIEHILRNLVDNAEKYSRDSADRRIHVGLCESPEAFILQVRDHGPGIAPELGRRIFRAFERGANPGQPPGLGLGLMLCHSLAAAQNATLRWHNAAEGGACFELCFPRES